jgi:chemotaxis protein MotB
MIASELAQVENSISIEGHTDAAPFIRGASYTNWELSNDRANAARRILEASAIPSRRIIEVTGFANRRLRNRENPRDPSNRRISLMLPFAHPPELSRAPGAADPATPMSRPAAVGG